MAQTAITKTIVRKNLGTLTLGFRNDGKLLFKFDDVCNILNIEDPRALIDFCRVTYRFSSAYATAREYLCLTPVLKANASFGIYTQDELFLTEDGLNYVIGSLSMAGNEKSKELYGFVNNTVIPSLKLYSLYKEPNKYQEEKPYKAKTETPVTHARVEEFTYIVDERDMSIYSSRKTYFDSRE